MHKFLSSISREQYLINADATDVLYFLDRIALELKQTENSYEKRLPEYLIEKLYERNERLVDLGIAVICESEISQKLLERYPADEEILANLLSNEISVAGMHSSPRWIVAIFDSILTNPSDLVLNSYLKNISISPDAIEKILTRNGVLTTMDDNRYYFIIALLLKNPILFKKPNDDYGYDLSQHTIISACWELLLNLPANDITATILGNKIQDFPEFKVSYSFAQKNGIKQEEKDLTKWARDSELLFISKVLKKWTYDAREVEESEENDSHIFSFYEESKFEQIRYYTIAKIDRYRIEKFKSFILSLNDDIATSAYFHSAYDSYLSMNDDDIKSNYDSYGRSFLLGIINTNAFYNRSYLPTSSKIYELISNFTESQETDEFDQLSYKLNFNLNKHQGLSYSEKYVDSIWDFTSYQELSKHDDAEKKEITNSAMTEKMEELSATISDTLKEASKDRTEVLKTQVNLSQQLLLISRKIDMLLDSQSKYKSENENIGKIILQGFSKFQNYFWVVFILLLLLVFNS